MSSRYSAVRSIPSFFRKACLTTAGMWILAVSVCRAGSPPEGIVRHYSTQDGLANNSVLGMFCDSRGFVWFSTWDGLSRFDGYRFVNYRVSTEASLSHSRMFALTEDRRGNLWLVTYDRRLFRLNRKIDRMENLSAPLSESGKVYRFHSLTEGAGGDMWALTEGNAVVRFSEADSAATRLKAEIYRLPAPVKHIHPLFDRGAGACLLFCENRAFAVGSFASGMPSRSTPLLSDGTVTATAEAGDIVFLGDDKGRFRTYDVRSGKLSPPRLLPAPVTCMSLSADSTFLVMGLKGRGLNIYDLRTGRHRQAVALPADIQKISRDSRNRFWVRTDRPGIHLYDPADNSFRHFRQKVVLPVNRNYARITEANGIVWAGMNGGGFGYYDETTGRMEYFLNDPDSHDPPLSNVVSSFCADSSGGLWLTTSAKRGVERVTFVNKKAERFRPDPEGRHPYSNFIRAFCLDSENRLWTAVRAERLFRYDPTGTVREEIRPPKGESFGQIYSIVEDADRNIWLGTKGKGLYRLVPGPEGEYRITHYGHDPSDPYSLGSDNVYQLVQDRQGRIWIATYGGGVNLLKEDENGVRFYSARNRFCSYPAAQGGKVRTVCEDLDGNIWAGTTEGIFILRYDPGKEELVVRRYHRGNSSLSSNDVVCIYRDDAGDLWTATYGGGLNFFPADGLRNGASFRSYDLTGGLPSNEVRSIVQDRAGKIWFATDNCIGALNKENGALTLLGPREGIPTATLFSEASALADREGRLWFGMTDGCYRINTDKLNRDTVGFNLRFTGLSVNDRWDYGGNGPFPYAVDEARRITLPPDSKVFGFEYVSLNYALQHRIRYRYLLEGADTVWHEDEGSRQAVYANLPAGEYRFRVRAFLPETPSRYEERTLQVVLLPAWWMTGPAFLLYGAVGIALVAAFALTLDRKRTFEKILRKRKVIHIGPSQVAVSGSEDERFLTAVLAYLERHYSNPDLRIEDMAESSGLSRTAFYLRFKEFTDKSPMEFLKDFRFSKARMYLRESSLTIAEITFRCGFSDPAYFTRAFKKESGLTPSAYRKQNRSQPPAPISSRPDEMPGNVGNSSGDKRPRHATARS